MGSYVSVHCHTCGEILNHGHDSLPGGLRMLFAELGVPVQEWRGKIGVDVLPALTTAIHELEGDADIGDYRRRHDEAGAPWSRVDFTLPFLRAMRDAICRDPLAVINA